MTFFNTNFHKLDTNIYKFFVARKTFGLIRVQCMFISVLIGMMFFSFVCDAEALSVRHHLLNATKNLIKMTVAPLKGIFITGPKNIKEAYIYEAYKTEDPKERNKLRGVWRAPGEEIKGILDGIVETVDCGREFVWEIISIPWGD